MDNIVLCGANSYTQKYYFNRDYDKLPDDIKKELQIACVSYTEAAGGIITLEFTPEGSLIIKTQADDSDYLFDEIESGLQISKIQKEKEDLFAKLELFYKVFNK